MSNSLCLGVARSEVRVWVARSEVRRAWESLVLRTTPTLRFGRATRKYKVNHRGRKL
jgi:hypothetical protein